MSKYILISFYPVHRMATHFNDWTTGVVYAVYGHIHAGYNEFLAEYDTEQQAIKKSFEYGVPVMRGSSCNYIAKKLTVGQR